MARATTIQELKEALEPIWRKKELDLLAVFGSVASGSTKPESDLDVAFIPKRPLDEVALTAEIVRHTHWNDVDAVDLRRADPVLAMRVAKTGVLLFSERPSAFTEFKSLAFRRFVDTEKLRRARRRALDRFEGKP